MWRFVVVNSSPKPRICAGLKEDFDGRQVAFANRHMQGRVIIDSALIRVSVEREKNLDDLESIASSGRSWLGTAARQGCNQGRKSVIDGGIRIGADSQQLADERQRTVVDGVYQARPIVSGIGPFGTLAGSSTAARNLARLPLRKAASILLKVSASLHR